jgi:phosphopantothenoylcysteine decarboxylase/phosphopantothenate--cysteine ligase
LEVGKEFDLKVHPSKDIVGTRGNELKDKSIVLCITGSVAAVQCSEIARELMRHGAEVFVVMSHMAQRIIHPYLMEWATGNPVVTELTGKLEHVALVGEYPNTTDAILVAPATANTISKIACGIDDTPVTSVVSVAFGLDVPILIVPAMHESMYRHGIITDHIKKLQALGVEIIGPRIEEGKAKIEVTEEIVEAVIRKLAIKDMIDMRLLVTAGPTIEYIDPVRVITNKSSGKMGIAVAEEARRRGAEVTLVIGREMVPPPVGMKVIHAETTKIMRAAVLSELKSTQYSVFVATAAAADFEPEKVFESKVDTHTTSKLELKLKSTPKIIDEAKKTSPKTFLVAFKAEYKLSDKDLVNNAYKRLKTSHANLMVANDVGRQGVGFQTDTNEVFVINKNKRVIHLPLTSKQEISRKLLDIIVEEIRGKS